MCENVKVDMQIFGDQWSESAENYLVGTVCECKK